MTVYPLSPAQKSILAETHPNFDLSREINDIQAASILGRAADRLAQHRRDQESLAAYELVPHISYTDSPNYPLNAKQKAMIFTVLRSHDRNPEGNDIAVSMLFTAIEKLLIARDQENFAWEAYLLNPLACYGTTRAAWLAHHRAA